MPINEGLSYLPTFVAAAEAGTFSEAARRLQMTQSAVSKQIQALERSVGATLFDRLPRRLILTEAGESLATVAGALLRQLAVIGDSIATQGERRPIGRLRIGTTDTIGAYVLPTWIRQLVQELPGVQPELMIDNSARILSDLQAGDLDLAIIANPGYAETLQAHALAEDPWLLVGSPTLVATLSGRPHWQDIDLPYVLPDEDHPWRQRLELQLFEPAAVRPRIGWQVNQVEGIKRFVREGLGITILPRHAVHEDLASGQLVMIETATPLPGQSLDLVRHRHRRASVALSAAWALLTESGEPD